jgi:RNA polymerase sigma-70 factor (ECF subfamily)
MIRSLFRPHAASLDTSADFSRAYEQTHLPVFRYIYGLTGGPQQDVEDLTAETFLHAWQARHSFHGEEGAILGWLLHIARNLVIDRSRRLRVRESAPDPLPAPVPGPEDSAQAGEEQHALLAMLQSLPGETREMLVLRYMLGWRVRRIAAHLEIPENTVSVSIHRALERLRRDWPHVMEE